MTHEKIRVQTSSQKKSTYLTTQDIIGPILKVSKSQKHFFLNYNAPKMNKTFNKKKGNLPFVFVTVE